ncbi:triosephosphate isomerase (TIM) [Sporothrix brasiliensis 5110]|uniref:Triosephosphate isomerase n=1 Tax=Sporothrix brasiliensis 5110 TaxID=1398154 RepID=A0A0C2F035_9PEZI|nr:triosephosphate isomerase (TIM) [Sporothrix brasiliensis 5110]KIH92139.1 triosephosphate isomerase (TIM) [Sporothrix brasiliensis 5110]
MASAVPDARRPIMGVSTKMYFTLARTRSYVDELLTLLAADENKAIVDTMDVFVCPDAIALPSVVEQVRASSVPLLPGAQDCADEDYGAFTGFVSPAVLADCGARLVEVGHAERRRLLGETDATTAAKARAAARNGLVPLVCVGELTRADGEVEASAAVAAATVIAQIAPVLDSVPDDAEVLLAYEPVWAIGAAQPASAAYVRAVVSAIRDHSPAIRRRGAARTRILYGGSAGPGLFAQLGGTVDGLFLGRFGHDPKQVLKTAHEIAGTK